MKFTSNRIHYTSSLFYYVINCFIKLNINCTAANNYFVKIELLRCSDAQKTRFHYLLDFPETFLRTVHRKCNDGNELLFSDILLNAVFFCSTPLGLLSCVYTGLVAETIAPCIHYITRLWLATHGVNDHFNSKISQYKTKPRQTEKQIYVIQ